MEGCLWARTWILGMPGKNSPLEKARAWVATGTERAERRAERASILAFWGLSAGDRQLCERAHELDLWLCWTFLGSVLVGLSLLSEDRRWQRW